MCHAFLGRYLMHCQADLWREVLCNNDGGSDCLDQRFENRTDDQLLRNNVQSAGCASRLPLPHSHTDLELFDSDACRAAMFKNAPVFVC